MKIEDDRGFKRTRIEWEIDSNNRELAVDIDERIRESIQAAINAQYDPDSN